MKKILFVITLFIMCSFAMSAQKTSSKTVTTKPSVSELISVAVSKDPSAALRKLATANGFKYQYREEYSGVAFQKKIDSTRTIYLEYGDMGGVSINSYTRKVVNSWESQIKRLGYYYAKHDAGSWGEEWTYTKPGNPVIKIEHSFYDNSYTLRVDDYSYDSSY